MKERRQRDFDTVMEKITEQGRPSKIGDLSRCVMNGEGGAHCSIGWLLDEDTRVRIDTRLGGGGVRSEIVQTALPQYMLDDIDFYCDLQRAHDVASVCTEFLSQFGLQMEGVRQKYGLS